MIIEEIEVLKNSLKTIDLASAISLVKEQPVNQLTLAELIAAYSATHLDQRELRLKKWLQAFGHLCAWAITSEQLDLSAQAMVEHGYSPATANRDLSSIGSVYRWAKEKRMSPRGFKSPTLSVRRFAEAIRRVHIEREFLDRLRSRALAARDRRFGCFVALLMDTGARKSELLERRWSEVDLDERQILAPTTKNGTPRVLFFSCETADLLRRIAPPKNHGGLIFEGLVPGQPISYRAAWKAVTTELGKPELRMHDIRHAAAANLLRSGVTLGVAAQVLGHDPAVLARRYGHLETNALKQAQEQAWKA